MLIKTCSNLGIHSSKIYTLCVFDGINLAFFTIFGFFYDLSLCFGSRLGLFDAVVNNETPRANFDIGLELN